MRAAWTTFVVAIVAIAMAMIGGCTDSDGIGAGGSANSGGNGNTGGGVTDALVIEPPTATIVVDNGSASPLQLIAKYKL